VPDLPDYTKEVTLKWSGGFVGLEELATRLGFPGPYNLQGNVVLMENFESEETEWTDATDSLGSASSRSSRQKYSGDWSLKLSVVNVLNAYAARYRDIGFPGVSKYGLFTRFAWMDDLQRIWIDISFSSNGDLYQAYLRYTLPTTTLEILTPTDPWYSVATDLELGRPTYTWYPILLTFNLETGYYGKLYFAHQEYDISSKKLGSAGYFTTPYCRILIGAARTAAAIFTVYVDDIIVVKNVP